MLHHYIVLKDEGLYILFCFKLCHNGEFVLGEIDKLLEDDIMPAIVLKNGYIISLSYLQYIAGVRHLAGIMSSI